MMFGHGGEDDDSILKLVDQLQRLKIGMLESNQLPGRLGSFDFEPAGIMRRGRSSRRIAARSINSRSSTATRGAPATVRRLQPRPR